MADVKANMLITLASLVITFSLRYFTDELLRWPSMPACRALNKVAQLRPTQAQVIPTLTF
jgi:hypothetical protein